MYAAFQLILTLLVPRVNSNTSAYLWDKYDTGNISHLTSCNYLFTHM